MGTDKKDSGAYHLEHQIPGGMMTNLKRQLAELKIEDRLEEFIEEAIHVRKDFGYPVMATPFSQIVGAQAVENCMVGERYKRILDQSIKYLGGHCGEPPGPVDPALMARINAIPEAKATLDWKPVNRHKPLEQLRQEVGPDLTDDEFLLQLLIPGMDAKKHAAKVEAAKKNPKTPKKSASTKQVSSGPAMDFPMAFCVTVDGEDYNVTVSNIGSGAAGVSVQDSGAGQGAKRAKEDTPGAVRPMMAGMLVTIKVTPDQQISQGEHIATLEAMKMLRDVNAPHGGVVKKIFFEEGEMLESDDILMIVEPNNE